MATIKLAKKLTRNKMKQRIDLIRQRLANMPNLSTATFHIDQDDTGAGADAIPDADGGITFTNYSSGSINLLVGTGADTSDGTVIDIEDFENPANVRGIMESLKHYRADMQYLIDRLAVGDSAECR